MEDNLSKLTKSLGTNKVTISANFTERWENHRENERRYSKKNTKALQLRILTNYVNPIDK